jgi:outer membrane protein assembly factor BamB
MAISDILLVPGGEASIVAFSPENGKILWADHKAQSIGQYPVWSIAFLNNDVFVARFNSSLKAYKENTGDVLWEENAPDRTSLYLSTYQDKVYFSANGSLKGYDSRSGRLLVEKTFNTYIGPILIENNVLYLEIGRGFSKIMAMDLDNFNNIWEIAPPKFSNNPINSLTIHGDKLFANGDAFIAIDKSNGKILWNKLDIGVTGHPVVLGNRVYVRNMIGSLLAFDIASGDYKGHLKLQAYGSRTDVDDLSPAVYDDLLIVPYGDDRVLAYRP